MKKAVNDMTELKNTTTLVKQVLETVPAARNSDMVLYIKVVEKINQSLIFKPLIEVLTNIKEYGLPTPETTSRCRRKLQAEFPELKANGTVQEYRSELEEDFREWAKVGD